MVQVETQQHLSTRTAITTTVPATTALWLSVGTRDGFYAFQGTAGVDEWRRSATTLVGMDVNHAILDQRNGDTLFAAAVGNGHTGVYRSRDFGQSWQLAGGEFPAGAVWHVEPGLASQPGRLYAGVLPAALYQSDDSGESWLPVAALNEHPTRSEWFAGGIGERCLHRILVSPNDPERVYAGISVAGMFRTDDGGRSWVTRNKNIMIPFDLSEAAHPDVHCCIHSAVLHPHNPDVIFQQNHFGVYRSDDAGDSWIDISAGLPARFGFVSAITREPEPAFFVVPQDENNIRMSGQLAVYRTRDGGVSWQALTDGLPVVEHITLYREAMATDPNGTPGVYFGTSEGDIWASLDCGDHWYRIASGLPPIRSLHCAALSG